MGIIGEWLRRLKYLLNRTRLEDELRQEMEAHRAAMGEPRRFGNELRLREESRDAWGWSWLDSLDLKLGWRMLRKSPGITIVGGLGIAVAVAIGTGVFIVLDSYVDPKLPIDEGDRVVAIE